MENIRLSALSCALAAAIFGIIFHAGESRAELANPGLQCAPESDELSPSRLVRAWSLDITGSLPDSEIVTNADETNLDSTVDALLESPEFAEQVVRHHRALLWNNVENVNIYSANATMQFAPDLDNVLYRRNRSNFYRGQAELPCLDEPATWDTSGALNYTTNPDGTIQEGWVEVTPYWEPWITQKVCAFDAQESEHSPSGTACFSRDGWSDPNCGCGIDLKYCRPRGALALAVVRSFGESIERTIRQWTLEDRSYLELFRTREMWVNGPIVHFFKYQTEFGGGVRMAPAPVYAEGLPDLHFTDTETWVKVEVHDGHSGILTSPVYLLRFQTNRSRADRFYTNFLCQPFQPPDEGLPVGDEEDALNPDLQNRPGCEYCHGILEPAAAYWGRWTETGGGYLAEDNGFSAFNTACFDCAVTGTPCSSACKDHYIVDPIHADEALYMGWLKAYLFRDDTHKVHVEQGPELLLLKSTVSEQSPFSKCTARQVIRHLLQREPTTKEEEWVSELALQFVLSDFDYRALYRSVLRSDEYRRVR